MHEELITALRACVDKEKGCADCPYYHKCMNSTSGKHAAMVDAAEAIEKLSKIAAEYEDAEEQGRMVILPCKVGDTLYAPTRNFVSEFRVSQFDFGGYEKPYLWVNWYLTKGITGNFRIDGIRASDIGKTVFLTREEAEASLKGGKDDV